MVRYLVLPRVLVLLLPCVLHGSTFNECPSAPLPDYDSDNTFTDMGVDEWKYTLCSSADSVQALAPGDLVYVDGWQVGSLSPHWLGVSEVALQDSSLGSVMVHWSGSPPVIGQTVGVGGKIEIGTTGTRSIDALTLWTTAP